MKIYRYHLDRAALRHLADGGHLNRAWSLRLSAMVGLALAATIITIGLSSYILIGFLSFGRGGETVWEFAGRSLSRISIQTFYTILLPIAALAFAALFYHYCERWRKNYARETSRCLNCGYEIQRTTCSHCPECGKEVERPMQERPTRSGTA